MMTKTDFVKIADTLDKNMAPLDLAQDFADMLEEDNPRFDRKRFIDASTQNLRRQWDFEARMLARELAS